MGDRRNAIITGSTSGIGLGLARALAASGANVTLNGFGDAAQIEAERAAIESEFGVTCRYSGADMSRPDQIVAMVREADGWKVDDVTSTGEGENWMLSWLLLYDPWDVK